MTYQPEITAWPLEFKGKLPVSELFYSIQGEGRYAGRPSIFIRLAYCNLGCIWCDTRYTWDPRKFDYGLLSSPEEITADASALSPEPASHADIDIVLTGGEPMLHQDRLPELLDQLRKAGFRFFSVETNGMYLPSPELRQRVSWWNCSPKLSNNGLPMEVNCVPEVLRTLDGTDRADFKFVVQSEADIDDIYKWYLPHIRRERVFLMPEGVTAQRQLAAMPWVLEACRKHGFRFSPRLHILTWGNERGR